MPTVPAATFGARLREHRQRLLMTQEELARRAGLSPRTIRRIENDASGRPRPPSIRLLADALGLNATALAENPPDPSIPDQKGTPPAQLPADIYAFTGREEELTALDRLLAGAGPDEPRPAGMTISAITGTAGVGKTALAVHWAHRVAGSFPDGQLYVNLRGFDPQGWVMPPGQAVRDFLDALGVAAPSVPHSLEAQVALYRSRLANKRVLILLDNARDAEHARPLLPGTSTAMVLVTSRDQLAPLVAVDGGQPLTVGQLSTAEARRLLTRRLGAKRITTEPGAAEQIITACARLPLALNIATARAQQTYFPLGVIADELARGRLDALNAGDPGSQVRAVFSWSYAALSTPAARLFRLLGLHPGWDISTAAAASLAGLPLAQTRRLLAELTGGSLLTEHAPGRFTGHDLLLAYAGDLAHSHEPRPDRDAAITRLLDHAVHTAHAADLLLDPRRDPIPVPLARPAPGAAVEPIADLGPAMAWLSSEHATLMAIVRQVTDAGFETRIWQLAWAVSTFMYRRGHWHDMTDAWQAALAASDRLADPAMQAFAYRLLGRAANQRGSYDEARTYLSRALTMCTSIEDQVGQAHSHGNLATLAARQGEPAAALEHAHQALALLQGTDRRRSLGVVLNKIGWYHTQLGEYLLALEYGTQALELLQQLEDPSGEASTWDSLGYAHHHLGQYGRAAECYDEAIHLYRAMGDRFYEADTLTHLGDSQYAADLIAAAQASWNRALAIFVDLAHPAAAQLRDRLARLDGSSAA